jgi:hypothetical protein
LGKIMLGLGQAGEALACFRAVGEDAAEAVI